MHDFGMKQQRVERARPASAIAATGALALVATTANPAAPRRRSRRGSPRRGSRPARPRTARRDAPSPSTCTCAWPNSRCGAGATAPPSVSRHQLHAVADAEHGHAERRRRAGSHFGAPASDTLFGPPDRMMPAGLPARESSRPACSNGTDLRVDRQLAQPPRDELRVLRPEIENDDGLMGHGRTEEELNAIIAVWTIAGTTRCCSASCTNCLLVCRCSRLGALQQRYVDCLYMNEEMKIHCFCLLSC